MFDEQRENLSQELMQLFEMKKEKLKDEKRITLEANEAQKDIQLVTLMFIDGIPNIEMSISENEILMWDEKQQKLLYVSGGESQIVEGTTREIRIRVRPYLIELVKKAKEIYKDPLAAIH